MSGHSHAKKIRREKEITDQKRGQIFSKLSKAISIAAREKGPNPEINSKLRLAIETAKNWNMPSENVERAIKKGMGELGGAKLEEVVFEAFGPGKIALIVEGITDNKNRTLSEIKQMLAQNNGKLAETGSVKWLFERMGVIIVNFKFQISNFKTKEELELKVIEAGVEDIFWKDEALEIYTKVEDLEKVKKNLENQGIKVETASLDWMAKERIQVEEKEKDAAQKLFEALDELESVQEIYSNLKI